MCGIFGIYSHNAAILESHRNTASVDLLTHRGPDDSGSYQDKQVFLGHKRLSIVDVGLGKQPMIDSQGRYVIVYNGEIYNYLELRDELVSMDIDFVTRSDTEVVLNLYKHFGPEHTLEKIEGMFSFGIWDKIDKVMFLARDRIGEKPLYLASTQHAVLFASEIKSILRTGVIDGQMNVNGLYEYFCRSKIAGTRTMFEHVYELNPGHYLLINNPSDPLNQRCYWDLTTEYRLASDSYIADELEAHTLVEGSIVDSVNSRMISDVPVGLLTSGGIDSSVIAGILAQNGYRGLRCFCAGNNNTAIDESPYAKRLVEYLNRESGAAFDLSVITKDVASVVDSINNLTYIYDEPLQFNNSILVYYLCKAARDHGIKVLISGEGSDEIFCGYDRYARTYSNASKLLKKNYSLEQILYYGGGIDNVDIVAQICGVNTSRSESDLLGESYEWLQMNRDISMMELIMQYDQRFRMQLLNQRQDRMGMAASVELRQPLLNYDLVNLANRLHLDLRFNARTNESKYILRRIAEKYIPKEIAARPKTGFPSDLGLWLRGDESYGIIRDLVNDSNSISQNYLDFDNVSSIIESHFFTDRHFDFLVTCLFHLEIWNNTVHKQNSLDR